jgi:hypothetical protein
MKKTSLKFSVKNCLGLTLTIIIIFLSSFDNKHIVLFDQNIVQQISSTPGWFFSGNQPDQYKTGIDNKIAQHGNQSATLESIVENPSGFCTLMQVCMRKDFNGKRIRMTGYIKSLNTTTATMWVRIDDFVDKVTADFDNMMDRPVSGSSDWTKCEIVFDATSKCSINYGFILSGAGKIWVDNVSFEIVDNSTNKTTQSLDIPFPEEYIKKLENMPQDITEKPSVNLDFEDKE